MATSSMPGRSLWWNFIHYFDNYLHLSQTPCWLLGAQMAVVSALLTCIGMTMIKASFSKAEAAFEQSSATQRAWRQTGKVSSPLFGLGLVTYFCACTSNVFALVYAPETTVAPLGAILVLGNLLTCYGVLHERFSSADAFATLVCVLSMAMAIFVMPRMVPGHMEHFPVEEFVAFCRDMLRNVGFMIYLICWTLLLMVCTYANMIEFDAMRGCIRMFTLPMLAGLFSSSSQFFLKLAGTLLYHSEEHPEVWETPSTKFIICVTIGLCLLSVYFMVRGVEQLDLRFFVPASFSVSTVLMVLQGVLFLKELTYMSTLDLHGFAFACFVCIASAFMVSPWHNTVHEPKSHGDAPLLSISVSNFVGLDSGHSHTNTGSGTSSSLSASEIAVLSIMDDHGLRRAAVDESQEVLTQIYVPVQSDVEQPLKEDVYVDLAQVNTDVMGLTAGKAWMSITRVLPALLIFGFPLTMLFLYCRDVTWLPFTILTLYLGFNTWTYGLHISLFSNVGRMKVEAYQKVDFARLFEKLAVTDGTPEWNARIGFRDVMHVVILPNYKEDVDILREAISSVAASGLATQQVALVLGMEARESGSEAKAEQLMNEFARSFRHVTATYHPPGIPGETPGKSSNTRWAARKVLDELLPAWGVQQGDVLLTVADADSEFHPEYFSALTYGFLAVPEAEQQSTIWQPPILHFKNYYTQPAPVRLASLLTSQHELANLADPSATRLPYSTYSISAKLVEAVDGWDPDWISEDWHMCLKCFLSTVGALQVQPVFLPLMNYTPEGQGWLDTLEARWTQAKRHALGVSELVYYASLAPWILADFSLQPQRRLRLFGRGLLLWLKMLFVHGFMATAVFMGPMNSGFVAYFYRQQLFEVVNSWTFLANCTFAFFSVAFFQVSVYTSVRLYAIVAPRIADHKSVGERMWWRSHWLHFAKVAVESTVWSPIFFLMSACAEWIATAKTAVTHRFDYEVALKPQAASAKQTPA